MRDSVNVNGIKLSYLDYPMEGEATGETLILLHGLTANAHSFDGLIEAGLNKHMRVIAVDLRGRGRSGKPGTGYAMADHARDIIGLMDALGLEEVYLGGHSFGGMVSMYLAAHYPKRVKKLVVMDAALEAMRPEVRDQIKPSLERLGKIVPSMDAYLEAIKSSPYYSDGFWNEQLEGFYRADVEELSDGAVRTRTRSHIIEEAIDHAVAENWPDVLEHVAHEAIFLHAPDGLGGPDAPPIISASGAKETADILGNCTVIDMTGHHITMLFGDHAKGVVKTIEAFIQAD